MVLIWLRDRRATANTLAESITSRPSSVQTMERNLLLARVETQSIWTVDLVMLLENLLEENQAIPEQPNRDNTTYLFCSQVLGVNSEHSTTGYYEKAFTVDRSRVDKLCQEMDRLDLPVLWPYNLKFAELMDLISFDHCIAILLMDNCVLNTNDSDDNYNNNTQQDAYMGHYIVLCGISRDPDHLLQAYASVHADEMPVDPYCIAIANPGISEPLTFVRPEKLETAWRADGTDCDVIFVAKHV